MPFVTVGTALWILIAYKFHQAMIDAVTGGREVTRQEEPRLYNLLENLCISRGIAMPKLKVMDDNALNAFATGLNEKQYSITVTSGLLQRLDDAELEAVLGHELTHIRNGDVRMLVIAVIIAGVVSFFAELVFRLMFQGGFRWRGGGGSDRKGSGGAALAIIIAVVMIAVAWLLSIVIRFALSRKREYLADAGSVELTKNPDGMITALRKIEGRGELEGATSAVMEMCVDNPRVGICRHVRHPPVDRKPHRGDREIRRRPRSRPAGIARAGRITQRPPTPRASTSLLPAGPWGGSGAPQAGGDDRPFLPPRPPIELGGPSSSAEGDARPLGPAPEIARTVDWCAEFFGSSFMRIVCTRAPILSCFGPRLGRITD